MFSLIIPYHNRERWLPATLQSLLACTCRPHHVLLVDNGSTDGSALVCRNFAQAHPDWNISLVSEAQPGACFARNAALKLVETEWVYFFDSDDELSPRFFEQAVKTLAAHPRADIIAAATVMTFPDGSMRRRAVQRNSSVRDQILTAQLATQGLFVRTKLLRQIGAWNTELTKWNDWELGIRLLLSRPQVVWLPGSWHRIQQHPDSLTGSGFSHTLPQLLSAFEAVRRLVSARGEWLAALAVRAGIVAAQLQREGSADEAGKLRQWAKDVCGQCPYPMLVRLLCFAISCYVRVGGRGAWMLARCFLRDVAVR